MKISDKKVGIIHYTLKDDNSIVLDSSEGQAPLAYIHGMKNLIPGMESALEGKQAGDKFGIVIAPEDAYGKRDERLVNKVPITNFPEKEHVKIGVQFQANTPEGTRIATIVDIENDTVTVDFNHQLADVTLHFNVEVIEVRDATDDELAHGHVHGEGCNH